MHHFAHDSQNVSSEKLLEVSVAVAAAGKFSDKVG
jgi:hypothetical protein